MKSKENYLMKWDQKSSDISWQSSKQLFMQNNMVNLINKHFLWLAEFKPKSFIIWGQTRDENTRGVARQSCCRKSDPVKQNISIN